MKKILLIAGACIFAIAGCAGKQASGENSNAVNSNADLAVVSSGAGNAVFNNQNADSAANVKPGDKSPKRIAFGKGADWGAVNITLAAGATEKFVVAAKKDQTMDVEVSSKETSVNLVKGKARTTEDFGFLTAELESNGDYVFEVKNPTRKEIKTSVKVTIEGGAEKTGKDLPDEPEDENAAETNSENSPN